MTINTGSMISITDANQNFSKAARLAEAKGEIVIMKNNKPKFCLIDLESNPIIDMTDDEKIEFVARRILKQHKNAFLELAK